MAQGDLALTLASLTNTGQLAAANDLTFNIADGFDNTQTGLVYAGNDAKLYVAGDLVNDQGAILAGHNMTIAGDANGARNRSLTNISGLIQADNDVSILTSNLTNKRLTTPTIERIQVTNDEITKFTLNPETWGKPIAQLFDARDKSVRFDFYPDEERQTGDKWFAMLYGVTTLGDGTSYRTRGITAPDWNMPWIRRGALDSEAEMAAWLKQTQPLNADGSPLLDPSLPVKSLLFHDDNSSFAWIFTWDDGTQIRQTIYEDRLTGPQSPQAMIRSGRDLAVDATTLTNSYSAIEAGRNAVLKGGTLDNEGAVLIRSTTTTCEARGGCEAYDAAGNRDVANDIADGGTSLAKTEAINWVPATIKAVGDLDVGGYATVNNTAAADSIAGHVALAPAASAGDPTAALGSLTAGGAMFTPNAAFGGVAAGTSPAAAAALKTALANAVVKPDSGGFGGTIPGQVFLYETRAAFLDVGKFYGSSYFIKRIGYNPDRSIPFLGDAYFENELVEQQLRQQTGQGFPSGEDPIAAMKRLLDNGVEYALANNLALGQPLTLAQIAALTESIVVYEQKTVNGVTVLAPVVYVAAADKAGMAIAGALISGGTVKMQVGSLTSSGAINAVGNLAIAATNLTLTTAPIVIGGTTFAPAADAVTAGGNVSLGATNDLTLLGANVAAGGNATLSGNNVTIDVKRTDNGGFGNATDSSVTAGGSITVTAKDSVNVIGSSVKAGNSLDVTAENGSVNVVAAGVDRTVTGRDGDIAAISTHQQQSKLISGGSTSITAGDDMLIAGSKLAVGGSVTLEAGDDTSIIATRNDLHREWNHDYSTVTTHTGSEISAGGGIAVTAGKTSKDGDLGIVGSGLAAGGKVELGASDDITVAEATDSTTLHEETSSRRIFSSKSSTTDIETTTAAGSSINGGEGVAIKSDGDTVISASKVQAGTDQNKAVLSITTGGELIIAAGKNTAESEAHSKGSGFLSKSSSDKRSYDETTVASELGASGNVKLDAGGNAVIAGSNVKAGGSIAIAGDSVSVIGAEEQHAFESHSKKSGFGAGSGNGFFSIWGNESKDVEQSATLNAGSSVSAGEDVTFTARDTDVNIIGSGIDADRDINVYAERDVNALPGSEAFSSFEQDKRSGFGLSFSSGGGASIGIGFGSETNRTNQSSDTNAVPSLSAGRDVKVTAGRDANFQAAQVSGKQDVTIVAAHDVNLLSAQDKSNYEEVHEKLFAGVTLSVSTSLVSTADSVGKAAQKIANVSDGYSAANAAFASLKAYDALNAIAKGGNLASASLTAGFDYSKDKSSASTSTPVVTTVRGGQSVTIEATSGSLTGNGVQIIAGYDANGNPIASDSDKAGDISVKAGKNILLDSAQATNETSTDNKSAGASVGISAGVGINGPNIGLSGGFNLGTGKSGANGTTQVNSHVTGTGDIKLESGNDTTLKGTVVSGQTVTAKVGGDLAIISVPDTGESSNKSAGFGMNFAGGLDFGSPLSGSMPSLFSQIGNMGVAGVSPSGGYGSGSTSWISEQSGLISKDRMDVGVAGNTSLEAGKILSQSNDLSLATGTLTYKDFSGSKGHEGFNANLNIDLTGGKGTDVDPVGNSTLEGSYQLDDTRQTVRATVGAGAITIRDGEKQAALEQGGATAPLADLNRDPAKVYEITKDKHVEIEFYLSETSVRQAIEAGKAISDIIGGLLDRISEPALASAIRDKEIDPKEALQQLLSGACPEQRGDAFDIWQWIMPSAYAAGCQLKTLSGKSITIYDRGTCIDALVKTLYAQTVGIAVNRDRFGQGLLNGVKDQGAEIIDLVSDPYGLAKTVGNVALEILDDPVAAAGKYGYDVADGLYEKSLLYTQALAAGDYEAAGRYLSGLAIDLAIKVATPVAGTAYSTIKTADKLAALRKIEKIEEAAVDAAVIGGKTCVYSCVIDGITRYVGVTDDVRRRGVEHLREKGIIIQEIPGLSNLSRSDARAVEQTLIEYYGLGKDGGTLINKINSISAVKSPTQYEQELIRGAELLKQHKYPGF